MKITVAPDSFKGSLSASHAADIIKKGIKSIYPSVKVDLKPMADGGEGTLDTLIKTMNGETKEIICVGPLGNKINTYYGIINNDTAVIEIAKICGLTLLPIDKRSPEKTTSFGVGETILHAMNNGINKIIIGLGGSATNDGGYGMLNALGVRGLDVKNKELNIFAEDLYNLNHLDWSNLDPRLKDITITVASDVDNPLCGEYGASYIYGKQKGGTDAQIKKLDQALFNYAKEVEQHKQKEIKQEAGVGAAGGLGFALMSIEAELTPGAELIARKIDLESSIATSDIVITGEGKSDQQTLHGKAPIYISHLAKEFGKPIILISGSVDNSNKELTKAFTSMFSIINEPISISQAMKHAEELLYNQVIQIIKLVKLDN